MRVYNAVMRIKRGDIRRIGVAAGAGSVVASLGYISFVAAMGGFDHVHTSLLPMVLRIAFTYLLPVTFAAALIGAVMYRVLPGSMPDGECRCRRCGYILKGLSRPECPECGEAV